MRDTVRQLRTIFTQDGQKVCMSVALVQEHGFADTDCEFKLLCEGCALNVSRREIAEIVQSAFACSDDFDCLCEFGEFGECCTIEIACMMRMNTGSTAKMPGICAHERNGCTCTGDGAACDHHAGDASGDGLLDDALTVLIKAVVSQIESDIDQVWRLGGAHSRSIAQVVCYVSATLNCSGSVQGSARMGRRLSRHLRIGFITLWCMCLPLYAAHADDSEIDDAAARMQYAFYTRDTRSLQEILRRLGAMETAHTPGMKEYYEAYGNWKLSQLYAEAQAMGKGESRGSSDKAAQECARKARAAVSADPRMAEAHAIEAICSSAAAFLIGGNCSRSKSMRNALEMEPQNPRIRLIEYLCAEKDSTIAGLQRLRTVVSTFDTAAPARPGKPDWGQAEALVLLGQAFLTQGDAVAARDALEKALVLAPDYRKAQELLQSAAVRPK